MIRYLRPASSDLVWRSSLAHSTYSGIESSSMPTNSVIRFSALASTTMPAIEPSSSPMYSPEPASRMAIERQESRIALMPEM